MSVLFIYLSIRPLTDKVYNLPPALTPQPAPSPTSQPAPSPTPETPTRLHHFPRPGMMFIGWFNNKVVLLFFCFLVFFCLVFFSFFSPTDQSHEPLSLKALIECYRDVNLILCTVESSLHLKACLQGWSLEVWWPGIPAGNNPE